MGTPIHGNPKSSNIYIGTLPPSVGAITAEFLQSRLAPLATSALETGKSIAVREARYPPSSTILAMRACSRRSSHGRLVVDHVKSCLRINATICSYFLRGSSPFTSRASMDASAFSGTTFCAPSPTYALRNPRTLSERLVDQFH